MKKPLVLVTGSASGLGLAIAQALRAQGHRVVDFDLQDGHDVLRPLFTFGEPPQGLDVLINCAGVNLTGWLEELSSNTWDEVVGVNAKGLFMMARWALPQLKAQRGTILNVISNASHVPMTCSAAYNASKGAAHILTLQMARELTKRHGITVFGISPNKLHGTGMSRAIEAQVMRDRGWTAEFAAEYQRAALLVGEETPPWAIAELVAFLLAEKDRHRFLTGCVIPYGA